MMNKAVWNAALAVALAAPAMAQSAKGIYVEGSRPAMKFNVLLERNGHTEVVPTNYAFKTGDRMKFQFDVNRDLYVYVLHRTVDGNDQTVSRYAGSKGIEVIRDDDRKNNRKDSYDLLFPGKESNNLIHARNLESIPRGSDSYFRMDSQPGMEKLIIVASPKPIKIEQFFDVQTGHMSDNGRKPHNDSDDDVVGQLTRSLFDVSGNSLVDAKGIEVVGPSDGYVAARTPDKAIVVTVDLRHLSH
jgi:hypothetical protein